MPKVSVLMPVYNTKGEYLKEAIESILNQTYSDFEFLIVDDGSTNEDTLNILDKYSQKDNRIRIIKGQHRGLGAALNLGINSSQGEYIARMDSDDISDATRFERQVKFLDENFDISILSCNYEAYPEKIFASNLVKDVRYFDLIKFCNVCHPGVMFRRNDFNKYDLRYNEKMPLSEDYELWARAIRNLKIANLEEVLLKYRVLRNSNSHKNMDLMFKTDNEIRQKMIEYLTSDKHLQKFIWEMLFPENFKKTTYTFWQKVFSVRNSSDKKHKIITVLGIKFSVKRKKK